MTNSNPLGSVNLAACGCLWSQSPNPSIFIQGPDFPQKSADFSVNPKGWPRKPWFAPSKKSFPPLETKMFQASFCCYKNNVSVLRHLFKRRPRGWRRFSSCEKQFRAAWGERSQPKKNAPSNHPLWANGTVTSLVWECVDWRPSGWCFPF